jgi:hypothetical protein
MAAKLEDLTAGYWVEGRAQAVIDVVTGAGDVPVRELSRLLRG